MAIKARRCYLSLGSNMGDPAANLCAALRALETRPKMTLDAVSPAYRTEPQGVVDQAWFLNCAARLIVAPELSPEEVLAVTQKIERDLGRTRGRRWGPRTLDMDLLLMDGCDRRGDELTLPHPRLCERAFVLVPLRDLEPRLHVFGHSLDYWLDRLEYSVEGDRIYQKNREERRLC